MNYPRISTLSIYSHVKTPLKAPFSIHLDEWTEPSIRIWDYRISTMFQKNSQRDASILLPSTPLKYKRRRHE